VYYEQFGDIEFAIRRAKRLKKWSRAWKVQLIEKTNPNWIDLFPGIARPWLNRNAWGYWIARSSRAMTALRLRAA